jgi:hypothetical protein
VGSGGSRPGVAPARGYSVVAIAEATEHKQ